MQPPPRRHGASRHPHRAVSRPHVTAASAESAGLGVGSAMAPCIWRSSGTRGGVVPLHGVGVNRLGYARLLASCDVPTIVSLVSDPLRVLVVVPALNEEAAIAGVIEGARAHLGADVAVVDDGSLDRTGSVAAAAGATVLTHCFNLGVGAAIRTGLQYASLRGYDVVVQLDGDGQHEVADARILLDRVSLGDVDVVIGSRLGSGYKTSAIRGLAMRLLARATSHRLQTALSDATSGFRAFGRAAIETFARSYPTDYLSDTVEALFLAADAGLRVVEVPVRMHERQSGRPSSGRVRSTYHVVRLVLVLAVHRLRRK